MILMSLLVVEGDGFERLPFSSLCTNTNKNSDSILRLSPVTRTEWVRPSALIHARRVNILHSPRANDEETHQTIFDEVSESPPPQCHRNAGSFLFKWEEGASFKFLLVWQDVVSVI